MCLDQGPQCSDAGEARTRGPSVSSQALYHWAIALPSFLYYMDLDATKHVFGVSEKARLKPVSSATETS